MVVLYIDITVAYVIKPRNNVSSIQIVTFMLNESENLFSCKKLCNSRKWSKHSRRHWRNGAVVIESADTIHTWNLITV